LHIKAIHAETRGGYGWPRTWKELLALGIRTGEVGGLTQHRDPNNA
jgi:putative transposase